MSVFRRGFPVWRGEEKRHQDSSPFAWLSWRENTPQWQTTDFQAYVEEGFNTNSLVYSAIMYKVRSKGSAPLRAYTGDPKTPEILPADHPLTKLVSRPNPHQSWIQFHALNEIYFNLGNSFIFMAREDKGGLPTAMYSLRPDRVYIIPGDGGIKGYLYVPEGVGVEQGTPILPEDMMHVKLPNPADPFEGLGWGMPPTPIGQSVDVDNDVTRFLRLFFKNGAMLQGLLKFDKPLDDDILAGVKRRWMEMYGGVDNWTDVGVLDQGASYQRIGATFDEMGFEAIDERNESRILGPFGVPPILLGTRMGLLRSTYSNYEEARRAYWEDTAVPELAWFEASYQYYLNPGDGSFVAFDLSKVPALQKDMPKLVDAAHRMWSMGVPANMAFASVGLSVGEIPSGDIGYIAANVVPAGVADTDEDASMEDAIEAESDDRKVLFRKQNGDEPPDIEGEIDDYQGQVRELVASAMEGEIDQDEFEDKLGELVGGVLLAFFLLGISLDEDDLVPLERAELDSEVGVTLEAVNGFSADIYGDRYEGDEGRKSALERVLLWGTTAMGVHGLGQMLRRDDPKLMWVYDPSKEHCDDCGRLHGQVHRASEWRRSGWRTQGKALDCGGWHCGCRAVEVADSTPFSGTFSFAPGIVNKVNFSANGHLAVVKE